MKLFNKLINFINHDKDYDYWYDNLAVPFRFDEITKKDNYFKFVYGEYYKLRFDFKEWLKAGKPTDIKLHNEYSRIREWDALESKYNYK